MIGEDEDSSLFRDAMAKQGIRRKNYADNRSNQNPLPSRLASKPLQAENSARRSLTKGIYRQNHFELQSTKPAKVR